MNFLMVTMFQMLSLAWLTDSLKVTAIGLIVVFAVLAILIVLIEALHFVLKERKQPAAEKAPQPVQTQKEEKRISAGVMAEVPEASDAEKDGDFIAAISAAITCATGNSDFKIKSIKKG